MSVKQTKHHALRPHSKSPEKEELAIAENNYGLAVVDSYSGIYIKNMLVARVDSFAQGG